MTYDSPKQIRNRQQRANDKAARRRQPRTIKVMTDELWAKCCDFHLAGIRANAEVGLHENAGRHARAIVTIAVQRRATELMRTFALVSVWKAMDIARRELLNCEIPQARV